MSFDKSKAMRNAERYVSQGKIRAAISEYRSVVENDPRDIATLNMLGDLHAKNAERREAVDCYLQVAEHYSTQGFAQKAIAIYNKISRIQPDSIEVSAKLAELHKIKGSLSEARLHYTTLAEHYQKTGKRLEALAMWKQIALLDPNNTDVCMNLADSYLRENQKDDAVEAYAEAGGRFSRQNRHEEAIRALMKGFDIRGNDLRILGGLVSAHSAMGRAGKAASLLEEILDDDPYNRDILYLLIECCIDSQNAAGAEKAVVKLVEIEPANYPRYLDLIRIYLNANDLESAARILSMSSEYLLAGGQAEECGRWINEILERDPAQLSALRLLTRYCSWIKDETGFRLALERLYSGATTHKSIEDERFALGHLVLLRPHETRYRDRLNEINVEYGFGESDVDEELLKAQFEKTEDEKPVSHEVRAVDVESNGHKPSIEAADIDGIERNGDVIDAAISEPVADATVQPQDLTHADEQKIQKELESIEFYIENDYNELAEKTLADLAHEFGDREEFATLRARIGADAPIKVIAGEEIIDAAVAKTLNLDEIRNEFGLEDGEPGEDSDYDTHYHMAVAYQEMGLMEEAIREYQDAVNLTRPGDGTRRFFQSANLLGHCFMQNGMANHAVTWFTRALETPDISVEESHGLWYELGLAHEANGDEDNAAKYFERVYAENVDFRDVAERVKNLVAEH